MTTRHLAGLCAVVVLVLALTGCGGGDDSTEPSAAPPVASSPAASADPDAAEKRAVLASYAAMWTEQMKAYRKAGAKGTDLERYVTAEALGQFRNDLDRMKAAGTVVRGGLVHDDTEVTALDMDAQTPSATVQDCMGISKWQTCSTKEGQVPPMPSAQPTRYVATATAEKWEGGWINHVHPGRSPDVLRRATVGAAAVVLVGVLAQAAHADGGKGGGICDGAALTITVCASDGPGTPYTPDRGKAISPDCGHLYQRTAHDKPGEKYRGTAIATWTAPASATKAHSPRPGRPHRPPASARSKSSTDTRAVVSFTHHRRSGHPPPPNSPHNEADMDDEETIARGVARGLARHEAARADANARQLLSGLLILAMVTIGFILLITYGG